MKRPLVALLVLAATHPGSGQSCFKVVDAQERPVVACQVRCITNPSTLFPDAGGLVCLPFPCDVLIINAPGFQEAQVGPSAAIAGGTILLERVANDLGAVHVEPWPRADDRNALATATRLDTSLLQGFERSSLRSAVQWIPGVQWDQRGHGGSNRLSIRGSLMRAPFGVRGVKVYWGPFALTLADGSTPLELLDPVLVGQVDIHRSVSSPLYGSGPSGLLLARPPWASDSTSIADVNASAGPFGFFRLSALALQHEGSRSISAGVVRQRSDGYRQQEWSARDQAFIVTRFVHWGGTTQGFITWQQASWALPGALDATTAEQAPRSARPYSRLLNAHVDKQQLLGGIATEIRATRDLRLRSGVHAQLIDKVNPYGTSSANSGYKVETVRAAGARLALAMDSIAHLPVAWEAGMEALFERDEWNEHAFVDAVLGDTKVDALTRVANLNAFFVSSARLGERSRLFAGIGLERTRYAHTDQLWDRTNTRTTDAKATPYMGLERRMRSGHRLWLRLAQSTSRPTVWELLGGEGAFNPDLKPEQVREWEFGLSNDPGDDPVQGAFTLFHRMVRDMIVPRSLTSEAPVVFTNADQAVIAGCELLVQGDLLRQSARRATVLGSLAVTATELRTTEAGRSESRDIPGIPMITAGMILRLHGVPIKGMTMEAGSRLVGSTLAGGNAYTPDVHVEHLRLSLAHRGRHHVVEPFLHVENLFSASYSSWLQVDDPGARYYNPAPPRSLFGGVRLIWRNGPRHAD